MPKRECRFVQFPHPGGEHNPATADVQWNVHEHRRKFLLTTGRYVDQRGRLRAGGLTLWGEWEPPSRVIRRWPADGHLPRVLHRPYWIEPSSRARRQNTDPWIWGKQMIYSNCKQIVGPQRLRTSMQDLPPGSVICFGSTIDHQFCLDTLFVVASDEPWVPAQASRLQAANAFKVCAGGSITAGRTDAHAELTLYRGATVDRPVNGMYSFVPAIPADNDDLRFARPAIELPGLINPASKQSTWGSKRPLPASEVRTAWEQPSSGACRRLGARGRAEDPAEGRGPQCCHRGPTPMLSPLERSASHRGRWRSVGRCLGGGHVDDDGRWARSNPCRRS